MSDIIIVQRLAKLIADAYRYGAYDPSEDLVTDPFCRSVIDDATEALALIEAQREQLAELRNVESCLNRNGFHRCTSAACNCGSWHQTGGLSARWDELKQDIEDAGYPLCNENGHILRKALASLIAEREAQREAIGVMGAEIKAWRDEDEYEGDAEFPASVATDANPIARAAIEASKGTA